MPGISWISAGIRLCQRQLPLRRLFMVAVMSTALMAVMICALILIGLTAYIAHHGAAVDSGLHAQMVAKSLSTAVAEEDETRISELLDQLKQVDDVDRCVVWNLQGKQLGSFLFPGEEEQEPPTFPGLNSYDHIHPYLYIASVRPVFHGDQPVGVIYFEGDLDVARDALWKYGVVLLLCIPITLVISYVMVGRLINAVADPLAGITGRMRELAQTNNYSIRTGHLVRGAGPEIRELSSGFDDMIVRIQAHDTKLSDEVAIRTKDLQDSLQHMKVTNEALEFARTEISRQKALLDSVFTLLPQRIFWKDSDGRYVWCNAAYARDTGRASPDDLVGLEDSELWPPAIAALHQRHDRQTMELACQVNYETTLPIAGGRKIQVEVSKLPMHDSEGRVGGILGVYSDVTEKREAQDERERLLQQLSVASRHAGMAEIATGVLHNVGNALNSVNVSAAFISQALTMSKRSGLSKSAALLKEHQHDLAHFLTSDERGKHLPDYLQRLADALDAESGMMETELVALRRGLEHIQQVICTQQTYARSSTLIQPVEPAELVSEAVAVAIGGKTWGDFELRTNVAPVGSLLIDKHKTLQILTNYISNAYEAVSENRDPAADHHIEISLEPFEEVDGQPWIRFSVTDSGVGIAEEMLPNLFRHGFTTKRNGHGFGLHACANSAKEMGGRVTATSNGAGRGATFVLELPARPPGKNGTSSPLAA